MTLKGTYEDPGTLLIAWAAGLKPALYPQVPGQKLLVFRLWVSRLSSADAGRVAEEIFVLCKIPGLDHGWFREALTHASPDSASSRMVLYFGMAIQERMVVRHHLRLLEWRKAPGARHNMQFGLLLFTGLVEAGWLKQPGEIFLAPPNKRDVMVNNALLETFHKDYSRLAICAREILYLQEYRRIHYSLSAQQTVHSYQGR